jgi:hypothetical protein
LISNGAGGGSRTPTRSPSPDFESGASARSTTPAMLDSKEIFVHSQTPESANVADVQNLHAVHLFLSFPPDCVQSIGSLLSGYYIFIKCLLDVRPGEQQMLAMGGALMQKPKPLLADGPALRLSHCYVDVIFEKLMEINISGTSILLVEQTARMAPLAGISPWYPGRMRETAVTSILSRGVKAARRSPWLPVPPFPRP